MIGEHMIETIKQRALYILVGILLIILISSLGVWKYFQLNLFDTSVVQDNPMERYLERQDDEFLKRTQDNRFTGFIPLEVMNEELSWQIQQAGREQDIAVSDVQVDYKEGWAKINYRSYTTLPIYHEIKVSTNEEGAEIALLPRSFGKKQLEPPRGLRQWIFDFLIKEPIVVNLNYQAYRSVEYLDYISSQGNEDGIYLDYEFYMVELESFFQKIHQTANPGLIHIYESGTPSQKKTLQFLKDYERFPENVMGLMYEDFLTGAEAIQDLLVLVHADGVNQIIDTYPEIGKRVDKEWVLDQRAELLSQATVQNGRLILEAFEKRREIGNVVAHYDYFFDIQRMEPVTVARIVEDYKLNIPIEDYGVMRLMLYENKPYVVYDTKEERQLFINATTYSLVPEEDYQAYFHAEQPQEGVLTIHVETYDDIVNVLEEEHGEEIFIRYMKDDGADAFVVYSPKVNYQTYTTAMLKDKGLGYRIIGQNMKSVEEVNQKHPDFNLNLVVQEFEQTEAEIINTTTRQAIQEGLLESGYIDENELVTYVAYDGGRYIAVMTESGSQYIYTIYRNTFLERVYPLEEAKEIFSDINPILTLQPRPE